MDEISLCTQCGAIDSYSCGGDASYCVECRSVECGFIWLTENKDNPDQFFDDSGNLYNEEGVIIKEAVCETKK